MSYVLITPIKDEKRLSGLRESVMNQSLLPVTWVIVDGSAAKRNAEFAEHFFSDDEWVHVIRQQHFVDHSYTHGNIALATNEAYRHATAMCAAHGYGYSYVGNVDATPQLPRNYFEALHRELDRDENLAIVSGVESILYKEKHTVKAPHPKIPLVGFTNARLYRKAFFESMGGCPIMPFFEDVLLMKAVHRGWKVKVKSDVQYVEPRLGGSKIGVWRGNELAGRCMHELGYHPMLALLNSAHRTLNYPPHYQVVPMMLGYLLSKIKRAPQVTDREVRQYFGQDRLRQMIEAYF